MSVPNILFATGPLRMRHGQIGLSLLLIGEALILARIRPFSDFYFPFVWIGFSLFLDAALFQQNGHSLFVNARRAFVGMYGLSILFWWTFELFNVAVKNWSYVGAERYQGIGYVLFASLDFSTVLVAVWTASRLVYGLLLPTGGDRPADRGPIPRWLWWTMLAAGFACIVLPVAFPRYAFGLIWLALFFVLDPINAGLGRPAIISAARQGNWRLPLSCALGSLICGFCWEAWNYWSLPKWIYHIPMVGFVHIFEMPILGWLGYLPFGLELFAMTNFLLPLIRLGTVDMDEPDGSTGADQAARLAS